jgi:hypothetical protein
MGTQPRPGAGAPGLPAWHRAALVRTLVISDLHLGSRRERDVLRRPEVLATLLEALDGIDRLVLLGDVVELLERRQRAAMAVAEPVLRAIGSRMGADREIILVPGNHDHVLVGPWLRRHRGPAGLDDPVPTDAHPVLATLVGWLGPAAVTVRYPGVWLSSRVWATHGHYLDEHLMPRSAFGVGRGWPRRAARGPMPPAAYERHGRRPAKRAERTIPNAPSAILDQVVRVLRFAMLPGTSRPIGHYLAPLTWRVLDLQMRRAAVGAMAQVADRLGVEADWVLFGHVHRVGPGADDDAARWGGAPGGPRLANTGSWVMEPLLVHGAAPGHPYLPGGALLIEDEGDPQPVALLDPLPDPA